MKLVLVAWLAVSATGVAAPGQRAAVDPASCASMLESSASSYRDAPPAREVLTYQVRAPGAERDTKRMEVGFSGDGMFVDVPGLRVIARGDRLFVLRGDAHDTYVSVPYEGDFAAAVDRAAGEPGKLFVPTQLVMRTSRVPDAWLDSLRFALLGRLSLEGCGQVTDEGGRRREELRFAADNGKLVLRLDATTHHFAELVLEMHPPGAAPEVGIQIEGRYTQAPAAPGDPALGFDPATRRAVASMSELVSTRSVVGTPAPAASFEELSGGAVTLASLRGKVVVLDFWATWCAPCWKGLREADALAEWASKRGLRVVVLAVNTLDEAPDADSRRTRVTRFWTSLGIHVRPVLDIDGAAFSAFASPGLPSTIVIGPDGTIVAAHTDVMPDLQQRLRREIEAALASAAGGMARP